MGESNDFDRTVGKIAGAIYGDMTHQFPHPPLMLVPALTFKVRKALEPIKDLKQLSNDQLATLATEIQLSIIPMLISYDIEADVIAQVSPTIKKAALRAMNEAA